jgi:UDP-glucose 4-epimerase
LKIDFKKKAIVTGCAGFIGSTLVDKLLDLNYQIIGIDNLSTGQKIFLEKAFTNKNFKFFKCDLLNLNRLKKIFRSSNIVFHFAANADVRYGYKHPYKDLEQNTIVTYNVLESMRENNINNIVFCSTGSVYGEPNKFPTPEDYSFPLQTSFYGASKLAGESLIQAYCESYGFKCWIFRFVSILGNRYTHGHVYDFCKQLFNNPNHLKVLGNGNQKKSYLHVGDCINAIILSINKSKKKINIFNLGTKEYITVKQSIRIICNYLKVIPKVSFIGGKRGWIGDSPFIFLNTKKIRSLGWKSKFTIKESIKQTTKYLINNKWVFKKRK